MYGATRFLFESELTDAANLTASSQAAGIITNALVSGTGSASLLAGGEFTGKEDLLYTVQISDITAGQAIGQAKYRWRESSMNSGAWGGEDIATHTALTPLNNGVMIAFQGGDAPHFSAGTTFTFRVKATFGVANLLTPDRGVVWRSKTLGTPTTLTYDCGASTPMMACVLLDHNLTDAATVTLKGVNDEADWGTPDIEIELTYGLTISAYFSASCRYWRLELQDDTNPDGYFELGIWYLGGYQELECNADWGASHDLNHFLSEDGNEFGVRMRQAHSEQNIISLTYSYLGRDDVATLRSMASTLFDVATGRVNPVILHLFSDEQDSIYLADLVNGIPRSYEVLNYDQVELQFEEVVKI